MIPSVWAESESYKAASLFVKGHWVTLLKWQAQEPPPVNVLAKLGFTKTDKHNQFGTRRILRGGDWLELDESADLVPFDTSTVFVAGGALPSIRPDHAALLRFTIKLSLSDSDRFAALIGGFEADDVFDLIRLGEVAPDNAPIWRGLAEAYCSRFDGTPDDVDLMRDIASAVAAALGVPTSTAVPIEGERERATASQWEPVAVLPVGSPVIITNDDGSERRAKLARTVYSDSSAAAIYQADPLWIAGVPVHEYQEVPRDRVRLDDGAVLKQVSVTFGHPVQFSIDDVRYLLRSGILPSAESDQSTSQDDLRRLRAVRVFVEGELERLGISKDVHILPEVDEGSVFWRVAHSSNGTGSTSSAAFVAKDDRHHCYVELAKEVERRVVQHEIELHNELMRVGLWAESFGQLGDLIRRVDDVREASRRVEIARSMAALGYTKTTFLNELFPNRLAAESALKLTAELPMTGESTQHIHFHRSAHGTYVAWLRSEGTIHDVVHGSIPHGVGTTFHGAAADWIHKLSADSAFHSDTARFLSTAAALDSTHAIASEGLDIAAQHTRLSEGIYARFQVAPSFANCSEKWLRSYADEIANDMLVKNEGAELLVLGVNKKRCLRKSMAPAALWRDFNGNRRRGFDTLTAQIRQQRGFKSAEIIQLDRLGILNPDALREIEQKVEPAVSVKAARAADPSERSDTGVVRGYARKHLYSMKREDLANALVEMGESAVVDFVRTSRIWPRPDWEKMRERGVSPELAALIDMARTALPSQYRTIVGQSATVAAWVEAVRELRTTLEAAGSLQDGIDAVEAFGRTVGVFSTGTSGSEGVSFTPDLIQSLRPKWNREGRRAYYSVFSISALEAHIVGTIQRRGAWEMISAAGSGRGPAAVRHSLADVSPLAHIVRVGPEWRDVLSITEEDLLRTFGFTGVEYGNWTSQKERAQYMNFVYDSFCDLADITGMPRTALSLGGNLGLTFGSRGRGGRGAALAHFEPSNKALALTRKNGAGSLSHEWFHAMANYFGVQHSAGVSTDLSAIVGNAVERGVWKGGEVIDELFAGAMRPEVYRAFAQLYWAITSAPDDGDWSKIKSASDISHESMPKPAPWVASSVQLDEAEKRKSVYWSNPVELFARGMEAWVVYRLSTTDRQNDYLIRDARISLSESWGFSVYPSGDHLRVIALAADDFFGSLTCEQQLTKNSIGDDVTLNLLYSRSGVFAPLAESIRAEIALSEVRTMLGNRVELEIADVLRDEQGVLVSGVYDRDQRLIKAAGDATISVIRHECWHAAHDLLLSDAERALMADRFKPGTPEFTELCAALNGLGRSDLVAICEANTLEAQGYAFELYSDGILRLDHSESRGIFALVERMFEWIREVMWGNGFSQPAQLFDALEAGALARRADAGLIPQTSAALA